MKFLTALAMLAVGASADPATEETSNACRYYTYRYYDYNFKTWRYRTRYVCTSAIEDTTELYSWNEEHRYGTYVEAMDSNKDG